MSAQSKAFPCPTSDNQPLQSYSASLVTTELCAQAADLHFLTKQLLSNPSSPYSTITMLSDLAQPPAYESKN